MRCEVGVARHHRNESFDVSGGEELLLRLLRPEVGPAHARTLPAREPGPSLFESQNKKKKWEELLVLI